MISPIPEGSDPTIVRIPSRLSSRKYLKLSSLANWNGFSNAKNYWATPIWFWSRRSTDEVLVLCSHMWSRSTCLGFSTEFNVKVFRQNCPSSGSPRFLYRGHQVFPVGEASSSELTGSYPSHLLKILAFLKVHYLRLPSFYSSMTFYALPPTQFILFPMMSLFNVLVLITFLDMQTISIATVMSPVNF